MLDAIDQETKLSWAIFDFLKCHLSFTFSQKVLRITDNVF